MVAGARTGAMVMVAGAPTGATSRDATVWRLRCHTTTAARPTASATTHTPAAIAAPSAAAALSAGGGGCGVPAPKLPGVPPALGDAIAEAAADAPLDVTEGGVPLPAGVGVPVPVSEEGAGVIEGVALLVLEDVKLMPVELAVGV